MQTFTTKSITETRAVAANFAKKLPKKAVLALKGELGAGKTTFLKALAKVLGVKTQVQSPTFVLVQSHRTSSNKFKHFFHLDLYRLKNISDLNELGLEEIIHTPNSVVAIEWPEKAASMLPKDTIYLYFKHGERENERIIRISS